MSQREKDQAENIEGGDIMEGREDIVSFDGLPEAESGSGEEAPDDSLVAEGSKEISEDENSEEE